MNVAIVALAVTTLAGRSVRAGDSPAKPLMQRAKYLLLDSRIIDKASGARLTVGTVKKHPANPLFKEDKPWEPRFDNLYPNVIYDEEDKLYKCWYNPMIIEEATTSIPEDERNPYDQPDYAGIKPNRREIGLCYAVSKDGIHWEKHEIGIVEFGGNKKNNILMLRGVNGAGVFRDLREPDPARRYNIFFCGQRKMEVAFSPDGLHWSRPIAIPEVEAHGSHANAFWAPDLGKYVGITRQHARGVRLVYRTESPDFVHWTRDKAVLEGPNLRQQTHDMVVFPTGGIYIGLLGMMEHPTRGSNHHVKQHVELAWSPDTITWHRIQAGTPFIGHTPAKKERYGTMPYDWGTIFASAPIFLDEVRRSKMS